MVGNVSLVVARQIRSLLKPECLQMASSNANKLGIFSAQSIGIGTLVGGGIFAMNRSVRMRF